MYHLGKEEPAEARMKALLAIRHLHYRIIYYTLLHAFFDERATRL